MLLNGWSLRVVSYVDGLVVNLEVLEALESLVGGVGLLERDLNFAKGGTGGRRPVHELNLADGADAPLFLVLVEFCEIVLMRRKKSISKVIEDVPSERVVDRSVAVFEECSSMMHRTHVFSVPVRASKAVSVSSSTRQKPSSNVDLQLANNRTPHAKMEVSTTKTLPTTSHVCSKKRFHTQL